jgi:hypothetical protein
MRSAVNEAFRIEKVIADKLFECFRNEANARVLTYQRIENKEYDIIVRSGVAEWDAIFNIKYRSRKLDRRTVAETVAKTANLLLTYRRSIGRETIAVIIFVSPVVATAFQSLDNWRTEVDDQSLSEGIKLSAHVGLRVKLSHRVEREGLGEGCALPKTPPLHPRTDMSQTILPPDARKQG